MTENEFWKFMGEKRSKGLVKVMVGSIRPAGEEESPVEKYMQGHAGLPKDYDKLSQKEIVGMGKLLFNRDVKIRTKESILIFLAHQTSLDALFFLEQYNKRPNKELEIFSQLALDECLMWNGEEDANCRMFTA